MLKKIPLVFPSLHVARAVLTEFRKTYRVALRGAVVTGPDYHGGYSVHLPLGGTGFSPAEAADAMRAVYRTIAPDRLTPQPKPLQEKQTMSDSSYNGWTNRATWAINLWFNPETREDVQAAREAFDDACADPALPDFLRDFIDTNINWRELEESCSDAEDEDTDD